jgi:bifunctional NMN adenylyltransferase/nudix hydrolase
MRIEMTHRNYSAAVLIGRFQPFHNTHKLLVEHALEIADKVLILVGSSHAAPTPKNPFTFEERKKMIFESMDAPLGQRVIVEPIRDYFYSDDMWLAQVQAVTSTYIEDGETVALIGNYKDRSSYYLNFFPQWEFANSNVKSHLDATSIRETLFDVKLTPGWEDKGNGMRLDYESAEKHNVFFAVTPSPVAEFLKEYATTSRYIRMVEEFKANRSYRESWKVAPFPPTFITADAVVTCGGHVLVVTRGGNPGKGLLALPGGFVRSDERIKDAAVRELKEETRIRVDKPVLKRAIVDSEVFDFPERSERGRTVTHAFHIKLEGKLPEVKLTGADDAVKCQWMPFVEVMRRADEFFEDHIHIINNFITS